MLHLKDIFFLVGTTLIPKGNNQLKSIYFLVISPHPSNLIYFLKSWGIPWTYFLNLWKLSDWEVYGVFFSFFFFSFNIPFSPPLPFFPQWAFYSSIRNKIKAKTKNKIHESINNKDLGKTGDLTQEAKIIPKKLRVKWGLTILP